VIRKPQPQRQQDPSYRKGRIQLKQIRQRTKSYAPTTEIEEEKLYVDPMTNFFWYGFGQGIVQGFSGATQYLSAWFHDSWDYITNQYYIVRHIKITEYKVKDSEDTTRDFAETEIQKDKGSNKKITDSTQTSVSQSNPTITNGVAQVSGETYSPYQYNAEAVDTNTGLQYLRARYYNSSIGSFITQDTYTGTLEDPLTQNLYTYTGNNPINLADPSGHGWLRNAVSKVASAARTVVRSVANVATRVVQTVSSAVRRVVNTVRRAVSAVSRTVSNAVHSVVSTVRSVSRSVSTAATSFYQNTVTPAATAFASYLESQMEAPEPVDPVTAGLESRFGGAAVTKLTESFAYVGGKFVTALSEAEHKMCTTSKRIKTNITNAAKNIDWSKVAKTSLDVVQGGLDIVGLIPGVGEVADGVNAAIYLARGDTVNAALSAAACIPFAGWAATGGKVANKTIKAIDAANDIAKAVDTASDVVKAVDTAKDVAKLADNIGDSAKASQKLGYDLQFFAKNSDDVVESASKATKGQGFSSKGYNPQPGERTFDGYVKKNVNSEAELSLKTDSAGFNNNSKGVGGEFKRFGTESHGGVSPHVHQPVRNVNIKTGEVYGGTFNPSTKTGGVTSPGAKDIKQLYQHLNNGKY
jgi:RHS repeat-associated protein